MRTWRREPYGTTCGLCGGPIEKGQPVLLIMGDWCKTDRDAKERCSNCAGESTPTLPELVLPVQLEIQPTRKPPRDPWRGMKALAADFKHKQAGDQ